MRLGLTSNEIIPIGLVLVALGVWGASMIGIHTLNQSGLLDGTPTPIPTATRLPTATPTPYMICQEIRPGGGAQSLAILIQRGLDPRNGLIYFPPILGDGSTKGFEVQPRDVEKQQPGILCIKQ